MLRKTPPKPAVFICPGCCADLPPAATSADKGTARVTRPPGYTLTVANWDERVEGRQKTPNASVILNGGGGKSYVSAVARGAQLDFGAGFKTAEVRATVKRIATGDAVELTAVFTCR